MANHLLANTKRKLAEFDRWRSIAGFTPLYFVDCGPDYRLPLYDLPDWSGPEWESRLEWKQQAPGEVNEIIRTVNSLPDERYRVILVMTYLTPVQSSGSWIRFSRIDIMATLGLKKSRFHELKRQALLAFAKYYRQGWLEAYTDQREQAKSSD